MQATSIQFSSRRLVSKSALFFPTAKMSFAFQFTIVSFESAGREILRLLEGSGEFGCEDAKKIHDRGVI